ncbi:MAG: MBOAT family protein [bacterium]|nr:MBOAT family protein [bacterium]
MLFSSFAFAVFGVVFYTLYLLAGRRLIVQNLVLLAGSYYFYGCWDWRFLGLIVLSTLIDFVCAWKLDRRRDSTSHCAGEPTAASYAYSPRGRRGLLLVSVVSNLGILGVFKYFDFFATSCAQLLSTLGLPLEPRLLDVVLPVGISFYTFQTMSYTIDVYRGRIRAHRSLLDVAVFVAFFPQLVAGPILRARDFLPQVARPRRLELSQVYAGGYLILWGLFKKMVIADNLARLVVDPVFDAEAGGLFGGRVLVALYAFAVQIYCDFSGYSDIARGCAKMLGFDICLNFNLPYFARNPADFWRRWHMSLSSWLRDYVYIPLGGNRRGRRRTYVNLMLTMLLGGLWHGAAWTFVLWGLYQGLLLAVHRMIVPWVDRYTGDSSARTRRLGRALAIAWFFQLTCLGWLIFRADSVGQIAAMADALFSPWAWWIICGANSLAGTGLLMLLVLSLPLIVVQLAQFRWNDLEIVLCLPAPIRGLVYSALFYGLMLYGVENEQPFIYFQF